MFTFVHGQPSRLPKFHNFQSVQTHAFHQGLKTTLWCGFNAIHLSSSPLLSLSTSVNRRNSFFAIAQPFGRRHGAFHEPATTEGRSPEATATLGPGQLALLVQDMRGRAVAGTLP